MIIVHMRTMMTMPLTQTGKQLLHVLLYDGGIEKM